MRCRCSECPLYEVDFIARDFGLAPTVAKGQLRALANDCNRKPCWLTRV